MEIPNTFQQYSCDYQRILLNEIALEGLEGVGLDLLWKLVEKRIPLTLTDKLKVRFWNFIINSDCISLYKLPEPVTTREIIDRFMLVDEKSGNIRDPDDYLDGPYEYAPVENEYGSCKYFKKRSNLCKEDMKEMSYKEIFDTYGSHMVMVASIEERWKVLAPHIPFMHINKMTSLHYCILELVGKARENGQMTTGKTNLTKIVKESKNLFYNRKYLHKLDLIRVLYITQLVGGRGAKNILLRLKRFHQPSTISRCKQGNLNNLVEYLLTKPDYCEKLEAVVSKSLLTRHQLKRLKKTVNIFKFEDRQCNDVPAPPPSKKAKIESEDPKKDRKVKYISLNYESDDESSQSEDETETQPVQCQYMVGIPLLRQAYEMFLQAGTKGLNQNQLSELLGVGFYTSRLICRTMKARKIVRVYLEDRGKQRMAIYVAVAAANVNPKYVEEQKKFMEFYQSNQFKVDETSIPSTSTDVIPAKRIKLEGEEVKPTKTNKDDELKTDDDTEDMHKYVKEIKVLDGCERNSNLSLCYSKKKLTLRQLRFANGLVKILNERLAVSGYQTLANLVAKEIDDTPMVTKAMKMFIQRMVTDGSIKIYRIYWPGSTLQYTNLICAAYVKANDPIIKAKFKEISLRAIVKDRKNVKKESTEVTRPLSKLAYPRYKKLQKLHEMIMMYTYFDGQSKDNSLLREGFVALCDLVPYFTIEFAISNISNFGLSEIAGLKVDTDQLHARLKDAPRDVYRMLLQSNCFRNTIRANLKMLSFLGLIQLACQPFAQYREFAYCHAFQTMTIYVNRRTEILDTAGTWPRAGDHESLKIMFSFDSFADVQRYWRTVYDTSMSTKISKNRDKSRLLQTKDMLRLDEEVKEFENGKPLGDRKGPCGFDSMFFMDIPRLWSTTIAVARPLWTPPRRAPVPKQKKEKQVKKPKVRKRAEKPATKPKPLPPKDRKSLLAKRRRRQTQDAHWVKEEDYILILCKVALILGGANTVPGSQTIRNMAARDVLIIRDPMKLQKLCHKRAVAIENEAHWVHEQEKILNEMRRRPALVRRFEGTLWRLRRRCGVNIARYMAEARVPVLEMVWTMLQVAASEPFNRRVPCLAHSYEELHQKYHITTKHQHPLALYGERESALLYEAVILSTLTSLNHKSSPKIAKRFYGFFKWYPETTLRAATEHLRKAGALAARVKLLNGHMHKVSLRDLVQSCYKMAMNYQRKWICKINAEFYYKLAEFIGSSAPQAVRGSPEINCFFSEMRACDLIDLRSETAPAIADTAGASAVFREWSAADVETRCKLKSGAVAWLPKHENIRSLYEVETSETSEVFQRCFIDINEHSEDKSTTNHSNDTIIQHLSQKANEGSTFNELQENTKFDTKTLVQKLTDLQTKQIITRVGFKQNIIILRKFLKDWSMKMENQYIVPTPWLTIDGTVRYDIFFNWANVIINKLLDCPGCSLLYLFKSNDYLSSKAIIDICMFLESYKCVTLHVLNAPKCNLFSDDDDDITEFEDFHEFAAIENMIVFPLKDTITKYTFVQKCWLDKYIASKDIV